MATVSSVQSPDFAVVALNNAINMGWLEQTPSKRAGTIASKMGIIKED